MPSHDVDARRIVQAGIAIAAAVLLAVGAAFALLALQHVSPGADRAQGPGQLPDNAARLESAPQGDLQHDRDEKLRRLHSSGWVDRERGVVHIPIEQAMQLLAARSTAGAASAASGAAP